MGTRTNILVGHNVPDHLDRAAVIFRLAPTLTATIAVRDYWISIDPDDPGDPSDCWTASPQAPPPHEKFVLYGGPGGFSITFGPKVAKVRASARWRGFLSIEPIRRVHIAAFRSITQALGASRIAYLHDHDPLTLDAVYDGAALDDCIAEMGQRWGPQQASVESIAPEIAEATEHGVPSVWFLEAVCRTHIPLKLAQHGTDLLIARSQAKRILARLESFEEVFLDFSGIEEIGHSFADEIFRVYATAHPGVKLTPIHANEDVHRMIRRAIAGTKSR